VEVHESYLERLPLSLVARGIVDQAEIWYYWRGSGMLPFQRESPFLARRAFRLQDERVPLASQEMLSFVYAFGAPHILCVLGLGVGTDLLDACAASVRLYNPIDAPALRVPAEVSARFDLILTGAEWQSAAVRQLHPSIPIVIMPVGPEFAEAAWEDIRQKARDESISVLFANAIKSNPERRREALAGSVRPWAVGLRRL
jgi:hypothetical protein